MQILVVSNSIPFPPLGGSRRRTYELVRALADRYEVTLIGFTYGERTQRPRFDASVVEIPWEWPSAYEAMRSGDATTSAEATTSLAGSEDPWFASVLRLPAMEEAVASAAASADVVLLEQADMGVFADAVPKKVPIVLDLHNVYSAMAHEPVEARRIRAYERRLAQRAALCLVCSQVEAHRARVLLGAREVWVVPNGVDTTFFRPNSTPPIPRSLVFTGTLDYPPNVEAAEYLVRTIVPLVRTRLPDASVRLVGRNPLPRIRRLVGRHVSLAADVPDIRPHLARAEQFVAPIRSGGGTRLKVLEAAASGKPIVTTSFAIEGISLAHLRDVIVADSAEEFADAVVALAADEGRRAALGANARQAALEYDWSRVGGVARRAVESALSGAQALVT